METDKQPSSSSTQQQVSGQSAMAHTPPSAPAPVLAPSATSPPTHPTTTEGTVTVKDVEMHVQSSIKKKNRRQRKSSSSTGRSKKGPKFAALSSKSIQQLSRERRKIPVPPHRMSPLRTQWMQIYEPVVRHLKLQIRMNLAKKSVELKTGPETKDAGALQKGQDFIKAFVLGFAIPDAIALVRLDDLYIETFEVKDIRSTLKGDHLSRAVGRITGKDGRTKFTIENATKTRIVVADTKVHILGSYENTRLARSSISSLVLGAAPGKVYNKLRTVSSRLNEKKF